MCSRGGASFPTRTINASATLLERLSQDIDVEVAAAYGIDDASTGRRLAGDAGVGRSVRCRRQLVAERSFLRVEEFIYVGTEYFA